MGLIVDSFDLSYKVYDTLTGEYLAIHEYGDPNWLSFIETENCRPCSFIKPPKGKYGLGFQSYNWPKFIFDNEESLVAFMLKWG